MQPSDTKHSGQEKPQSKRSLLGRSHPAEAESQFPSGQPDNAQRKHKVDHCALCERRTVLTFHHLIPKKAHRRPRFRKRYDRATLAAGIRVCRLCHRGIHKLYSEIELAERLSSLAALKADEALKRHVSWVRKQQPGKRL